MSSVLSANTHIPLLHLIPNYEVSEAVIIISR